VKFTNSFCSIGGLQEELKIVLLSSFIRNKQNGYGQEFRKKPNVNIFIINQFFTKNKIMTNLFSSFSQMFHESVENVSMASKLSSHSDSNVHERHFTVHSDSFGTNVYFIDNFNISRKPHFDAKKIINIYKNNLFYRLNKTVNSEIEYSFIVFSSFPDQIAYTHNTRLLLNNLNFFNLNLCFCLFNSYPQVSVKKNMKTYNNSKKKYFQRMQQYFYFINLLEPVLTKKTKNFAINLYMFLKKQNNIKGNNLSEITITHLESLGKVSEIISKFYFSLYIEEFAIKTAARILIFSINSYSYQQYNIFHSIKKKLPNDYILTKFKIAGDKITLTIPFSQINVSKNNLSYVKNIGYFLRNVNFSLKIAILKEIKKNIYGLKKSKILIILTKILLNIRHIITS